MKFFKGSVLFGSVVCLASCGGSSTDDSVTRVLSGDDALNYGTQAGTQSSMQLPFAGDEVDLVEDFAEIKVVVARFISDEVTGETTLQISQETGRDVSAFGGDLNGSLSLGGELIAFTDSVGTRSDGARVRIEEPITRVWSSLFSISSYVFDDDSLDSGENTEGVFVVGQQTDPSEMPTTLGTVNYGAGFVGAATLLDQDGVVLENDVSLFGEVNLGVRFADRKIDGSIAVEADVTEGVLVPFTPVATFVLDEADIVGNGFAAPANTVLACEAGSICTADADVGGVFFGTDASELSGIATIDYTEVDGETLNGLRFIGVGGFVATEPEDF